MADFLDYNDVSMEYRGAMMDCKLKLTDDNIIFKANQKGSKTETLERQELEMVNWQRLAGSWGIRIFTKSGNLYRFAGFKDTERDRLARFFKQTYDMDMLDKELSVKGHNWGMPEFTGGIMSFEIGKADGFEIPLPYVNQCIAGKNEATLEFHLNDDAPVNLSEMRFFIPGSELAGDDPVEAFKEKVMQRASVVTTAGDAITILRGISCLSPRGRYDITIYPTYFSLHGKTFDYKIPASSVMRLFLLPHKDQRQMHFAVNLDPPIKQGQTRYHFLVFNFKMEDEEEIELPYTDEEVKEKFDGKLEREISGPTYEVISSIVSAVVDKKVTTAGKKGSFVAYNGTPALTCSHKAASGFIYPLERGMIFIYKPPIYLRYDEIKSVSFERSGGSTRSFDVSVTTKNDISYTFSSIEKNEYQKLYDYFKSKKVNVKAQGSGGKSGTINWDEDDKVDHYLEGVKRDAEENMLSDASMSSDDTDFNPDALEALSAKEEYDSEPSSTSDDTDGEEVGSDAEKRRAERKQKKEEKAQRAQKRAEKGERRGERKERKQKKTKLPGQPKRNQSSYMIWMNANRDDIKKTCSGGIAEIAKKAGELWKALEDKSEWEEKAAEEKKRYEAEYKKWLEDGGADAIKAQKKQAKAAKKAATGGGGGAKPKSKSKTAAAPSSSGGGGAGGGFKSKEFIEDDSTDASDSDDSGKKKKKKGGEGKKSKAKSSSDEEMKSGSGSGSAAASAASSNSD